MLRKAPPLENVEIFVAAARAGSFRAVARNLALSPSAVSRRIAGLEAFLNVTLFERSGTSVRLNAAGHRYLALVEPAIDAIQKATCSITRLDRETLRVATSHSFASCWLIPRLADLKARCGIEIEIIASRDPAGLRAGAADIGIWGGLGRVDGLESDILFEMEAVPVMAPCLAAGRREPMADRELAQLSLVGVRWPVGMWERWFAVGGFRPTALDLRELSSLQMAYETAAAGFGATLAIPLLAEQMLEQRKLVPIGMPRRIGEAYQSYRSQRQSMPADGRFLDWLHDAVSLSVKQFDAVSLREGAAPIH